MAQAIVPFGVQDSNARIVQALDQLKRLVLGLSDRNNDFIAKGKDGSNGFQDGVIQKDRIPNKGKTADFQFIKLFYPRPLRIFPRLRPNPRPPKLTAMLAVE